MAFNWKLPKDVPGGKVQCPVWAGKCPPSSSYARSLPEPANNTHVLQQVNRETEVHAIHTVSWVDLNGFMLSVESQVQKVTYGMTLLIACLKRQKYRHAHRFLAAGGWGAGGRWPWLWTCATEAKGWNSSGSWPSRCSHTPTHLMKQHRTYSHAHKRSPHETAEI